MIIMLLVKLLMSYDSEKRNSILVLDIYIFISVIFAVTITCIVRDFNIHV